MSTSIVIICGSYRRALRRVSRKYGRRPFQWVYLGANYATLFRIRSRMPLNAQEIAIGPRLQLVAEKLRREFVDYIAAIRAVQDQLWWYRSISEKNPFVSDLFLYACYIVLVRNSLRDEQVQLIVTEDRFLAQALLDNLPDGGNEGSAWMLWYAFAHIRAGLASLVRKLYFVAQRTVLTLQARRYARRVTGEPPATLMHSWVDVCRSFAGGRYRSLNFGDLPLDLQSRGERVVIAPRCLPGQSRRQVWRRIRDCGVEAWIPEAHLRLRDIVWAAWLWFRRPLLGISNAPRFHGADLRLLIRRELLRDWAWNRGPDTLLANAVVRNWRRSGLRIKSFIYTFENHTWEKAYVGALRTHYPDATVIGYQDTSFSLNRLNVFIGEAEAGAIPSPDRLVVNGEIFAQELRSRGWSRIEVVTGAAYRYMHLRNLCRMNGGSAQRQRGAVLVVPSLGRQRAIELLTKVRQALGANPQRRLFVKCHPTTPYRILRDVVGELPEHFVVTDQPLFELLARCAYFVFTDTTAVLEALAAGLVCISVSSDCTIDLDVLDLTPEARLVVSDPRELRTLILKENYRVVRARQRESAFRWMESMSRSDPEVSAELFRAGRSDRSSGCDEMK